MLIDISDAALPIKKLSVRMPSTAEINFCRALAFRLAWPSRYNEYRLSAAGVLHIELGLKIRAYVLR